MGVVVGMFVRRSNQSRSRFSLLLLYEGEYYFEDFEATYYPPNANDQTTVRKKQVGRLKICSKSILFAPDNSRYPVMRFLFDSMIGCGKWNGPLCRLLPETQIFYVRAEKRIECKIGGQNHPYRFVNNTEDYRFSLQFESLLSFLPKLQNLLRISQLHTEDCEKQLQHLIKQRESLVEFNSTWLVNISEKQKIQETGVQLTPLVQNPGRILITDQRLYFQPLNNAGPNPVDRYELADIERIITRRHVLRHIGLEIFFKNKQSIYLSFRTTEIRDRVFSVLKGLPIVPTIPPNDLELTTYKWRNGTISNYDYLMYLNTLAHRSFNDLTQYPVFPWVIADYTSNTLDLNNPTTFRDLSKPIGALNESRLEGLRMRFKEMAQMEGQIPFLYGTHYSAPGYVLYYLVRQAPEYMLRLQSGRFDAPDRMFHSISETWQGVLVNPSDVKELIPEFYSGTGEFLTNSEGLTLGAKSNGETINDVILPPWASSPADFVSKCRAALESEYVSQHLHKWIDLIFGYAQLGQAAIDHDNVFYYITYEGAVDIEKIYDPREKKSIEAQINEFGQTPHQLFTSPHPARIPKSDPALFQTSTSSSSEQTSKVQLDVPEIESLDFLNAAPSNELKWPDFTSLQCNFSYKLHRDAITAVNMTKDQTTLFSVSKSGNMKIFDLEKRKQMRNIPLSKLALSSCILSEDETHAIAGAWDNYIYLYSIEFGKVKEKVYAHEDAILCMQMRRNNLVSGSWDSTVKSWQFTNSSIVPSELFNGLESMTAIKSIDLSPDSNICVCGTDDGKLLLLDQRAPDLKRSLAAHNNDSIVSVSFAPDSFGIMTGASSGTMKYIDVRNFDEKYSISAGESLLNLQINGNQLVAGTEQGSLQIWDLEKREKVHTLSDMLQQQKDIASFVIGEDCIVSGSSDCTICLWN